MANKIYYSKTTLTGGGATALDSIDAAGLVDGDFANVIVGAPPASVHYLYKYDADSAVAEASPGIIKPDTGTTDGRWILLQPALVLKNSDGTWYQLTLDTDANSGAIIITPL
ncbi:MAG: hypothetical protein WC750_06385 [Patescibacteria group bacterium]|jgi:hypothetical protein